MSDVLAALEAVDAPAKQDKLTKALASMGADEQQAWLDIIAGRTIRDDGQPYSVAHIERAMQHKGYDVSTASIGRRRRMLQRVEVRG